MAYNFDVVLRAKHRYALLIVSALSVGAVTAYELTRHPEPQFAFLKNARAIAVQDGSVRTSNGTIFGTTTYFSFRGDWRQIYQMAQVEMPSAIVRDTMIGSTPARVLTVPRIEDGRTRLFFPPAREVTITPDRLLLTESGQVASRPADHWASIKVSEYRQPHVIEDAVNWVRDHFSI